MRGHEGFDFEKDFPAVFKYVVPCLGPARMHLTLKPR